MRMKPARQTSATRRSQGRGCASAARARRSRFGMTATGMPDAAATPTPGASARLLITRAISAGEASAEQAVIRACRLEPRPEISTPTLSRAIAAFQLWGAGPARLPGGSVCRWRPRKKCRMTAARRRPAAAKISGRRRFAMVVRLMTACALLLLGTVAMRAGPAPAQEADQAYSATVKVDATADSAAAARETARIDGQRRALAAVIERLSGASETAKPPKLDDKAITDMVASFEVANERMSAVRYVADYTFHFRPSKVRRLVLVAATPPAENGSKSPPEKSPGDKSPADIGGKSPAEGASKPTVESGNRPVVVLPVYRDGSNLVLWDEPNAWRMAWSQRPAGWGPGRLVLPLGDAGDLAAIDAEKAGSGRPEALTAIAQRNSGSEAVVALATARRQDSKLAGLDVTIKRYRSGHLVDTQASSFEANPAESEADLLKRAAESTAAEIESGAKRNAGARSDQPASLAVTVPITNLGEWVQVRDRLASVSSIRKIDLLSLSRQEARIEVKYVGSQDQLKSSLAEVNLDLGGGDPAWRIQSSGAASAR